MLKIIGIGGSPAVGKSTLMRKVVRELGKGVLCKTGILVYQRHDDTKTIVLGSYAKKGFGGTDRLSMGVQPIAVGVIQAWASDSNMKDWTVLFEGDRLFNSSFINSIVNMSNIGSNWIVLDVSEEELLRRHFQRKDTQSEKWLKGRRTKILRIKEKHNNLEVIFNASIEELNNNSMYVLSLITCK